MHRVVGVSARAVIAGVVRTSPKASVAERLLELHRDLRGLVDEHRPQVVAIEPHHTWYLPTGPHDFAPSKLATFVDWDDDDDGAVFHPT